MIHGKIAELRTGQTYQSGVHFIKQGQRICSGYRAPNGNVWSVSNSGLPVCSASQGEQHENGYSRNLCRLYRQTTTHPDQSDKEICKIPGDVDQQSGPYCAGRIFSKEGSCQKRRNKLRYHIPLIVCGSKSSRRFTISLFQPTPSLFPLSIQLMN